uniref:Arginine kinase n=1 Tax=Tyrophagus putrescentiae TaxID=59818 RepID=A0A977TJM0_TYRPU|nr:Tyr p 20 allergen [Tyrophagus putrescentiae]
MGDVPKETLEKLEAGFAKLQGAADCKSLLKKHLTKEIFEELKGKKTQMGATLLDVVQSGMENLDSGVGMYAPDAEAYTVFENLFNPVIEEYHFGFKATDKHPASDFGNAESLCNLDPNSEFVISTRVRCGRSLKGFQFNPCMTEENYKDLETKVKGALEGASGELKGIYYPLVGMDKTKQQKLIDLHYLFKEGDRFLQAANASRFWPTGRGIFINLTKTFCTWINEEDHIRIISLQEGGNLKTVYSRMLKGLNYLSGKLEFNRSDRLGFLTFCPTNLGTTIRASVHIMLPKLAANKAKLDEVAEKYKMQVRGETGEHSDSSSGIFDISNKRRLGLTEFQALKEMQEGILELIKIEKSL